MPKRPDIDWAQIQRDYVTATDVKTVTHGFLAKKYRLKVETVREHASVEKWSAARTEYQNRPPDLGEKPTENYSTAKAVQKADWTQQARGIRGWGLKALGTKPAENATVKEALDALRLAHQLEKDVLELGERLDVNIGQATPLAVTVTIREVPLRADDHGN